MTPSISEVVDARADDMVGDQDVGRYDFPHDDKTADARTGRIRPNPRRRLHLGEPVSFTDLPSRAPAQFCTSGRLDPYYTGLRDAGLYSTWTNVGQVRREIEAGLIEPTMFVQDRTRSVTPDELLDGYRRASTLSLLGALMMWRTMTTQQAAAFTGMPGLTATQREGSVVLNRLFASGLMEVGSLQAPHRAKYPELLRPDGNTDFSEYASRLTMAQWLATTGGRRWKSGSQSDRHNILTTELGLRVAQFCPEFPAVFGESMGGLDLLMGRPEGETTAPRATDAVLVRADGLKVAVEVTATVSTSAERKMVNWVEELTSDRTGSTVVLFVAAAKPSADGNLAAVVRRRLMKVLRQNMEAVSRRVWERFFVVSWDEWFPGPGQVAAQFPTLPVAGFTGAMSGLEAQWVRQDLASVPFTPAGTSGVAAARTILAQSHMLEGVPHWLRNESVAAKFGPRLDQWLSQEAGFGGKRTLLAAPGA